MRICVLEEVAVVKELLCVALELRHHQITTYQAPSMCLEYLSMKCCCELLIIGDHPQTGFSWREAVEQVRTLVPDLPVVLISNITYSENQTIEQQVQRIKVLDEPFHLKDFYAIIDEFEM